MNNRVVIDFCNAAYCDRAPFHPSEQFPELGFSPVGDSPNPAYALIRTLFLQLGYDAARFGQPDWNPLGHLLSPGQTVVLKPNFVLSRNWSGDDLFAVVTHPSILRALADYCYIALKGKGRIVIADAPQMDCCWADLMAAQRLDEVQAFYKSALGFDLELYDLREFELIDATKPAYASNRTLRPGDPAGSVMINLGERSAFTGTPSANLYGADYNRDETIAHHHDHVHEYCVSKTILAADLLILVPKMKVHKKVGVTLCLKGLVGMNTNKNCLVHYRVGTPRRGGDQLPDQLDSLPIRIQRWMFDKFLAKQNRVGDFLYRASLSAYRTFIKPFRKPTPGAASQDGGNWHGNDSTWRMVIDLAAILFFADAAGHITDTPQRKMLCIVDGIVAGEGEGPLAPTARKAGCIAAGENPLATDIAVTRLIGFDPKRLRLLQPESWQRWNFGIAKHEDLEIAVSGKSIPSKTFLTTEWTSPVKPFNPHSGWLGHIEIQRTSTTNGHE